MSRKDPYSAISRTLPLLDHMHRFLLPGISRDMVGILGPGNRKVLDVACGTGYMVCALHRLGYEVTGVDRSPGMLSLASQKAGDCHFVLGDGCSLPFVQDAFDGAVISLALHEMSTSERAGVWSGMKRVVKPGGKLFLIDFPRLPGTSSLLSRAAARAILHVERSTLKFDPDHWHHSVQFQEEGGLAGWLSSMGEELAETRVYLWGNIVMGVVDK